jgi:hypothetical protein
VQFLAAGQDGDQDFCLRRHLVRCALRAKSPRSAPSCRQLLRAWRRGLLAGLAAIAGPCWLPMVRRRSTVRFRKGSQNPRSEALTSRCAKA